VTLSTLVTVKSPLNMFGVTPETRTVSPLVHAGEGVALRTIVAVLVAESQLRVETA
jgi:hypothetical protein